MGFKWENVLLKIKETTNNEFNLEFLNLICNIPPSRRHNVQIAFQFGHNLPNEKALDSDTPFVFHALSQQGLMDNS